MTRSRSTLTMLALLLLGCSPTDGVAPDRPVTAVVVSPAAPSLVVGQSIHGLAVTLAGGFSSTPVVWSSANPAVATVTSAGLVSAIAAGSATVTATAGGVAGSAALVVAPGAVDRVSVCDRSMTPDCMNSATLAAVGTSVVARASAWNSLGADISQSCVFQWTPGTAGVVSVATSADATKRDALITRTAGGTVSLVVSCNGVPGVFTVN